MMPYSYSWEMYPQFYVGSAIMELIWLGNGNIVMIYEWSDIISAYYFIN